MTIACPRGGRIGGEPANEADCEISSQPISMTHTQLVAIAGLPLALHKSLNLTQSPPVCQLKLSWNVRFSESRIYTPPGEVKILLQFVPTSALLPLCIFQHRLSVMLPDNITSQSKTLIMVPSSTSVLLFPLFANLSHPLENWKSYFDFDFRPYNSMRSSDCHNLRLFQDRRER